ncbi:MAG: gamma-glutamyl-gamma-aminobutyrate hydrolase family protein, partial [Chloroflexota bacterium]
HHQAVDKLGKGLRITATAADGIVEGVELKDHPFCVGVQWHPEIKDGNPPEMVNLYRAFLQVVA